MKRFITYVVTSLFAFNFGVSASALWPWSSYSTEKPASLPAVPLIPATPALTESNITAPVPQIVFGGGRLKLVSEEAQLKSQSLQYDIKVRYPHIVGANEPHIQRLNRRIEELVSEQYYGIQHPLKEDLRYYRQRWPEALSELFIDYVVTLATDSILSIYFNAYSYGIGAGTSVQYGFTVNYDLVSGKELKLSDFFQHRANYLAFISRYCTDQLATHKSGEWLHRENLAPVISNFDSWNITRTGIRFNFDEGEVFGCSEGEQAVEIPFAELKSLLSARGLSILRNSSVVGL